MQTRVHRIEAPAKLNIRLKITGKRPDGYHELVSIMVPVALLDFIEVQKKEAPGIDLSVRGIPLPGNEGNLVTRAAKSFCRATGFKEGLWITLIKNIPVGAGLGGGSSDAAAALLLLNEICSAPLSDGDLRSLALQIGADVPFFLLCEPCLATGIGEILEPIEKWPKWWYLIVSPRLPVSTAWVYQNFRMKLTKGEHPFIRGELQKDSFSVSQILENDLESVTSEKFPIIRTIKELLMENGAEGALMTGSGSSVFGVFSSLEKAQSARDRLALKNVGDVFVTTEYRKQNKRVSSRE